MKLRESTVPTPYGVHCCGDLFHACNDGEIIYLTEDEYMKQMGRPDALWKCPRCGHEAWWDDDNYDTHVQDIQKSERPCPNCQGTGYDHGVRCICQE